MITLSFIRKFFILAVLAAITRPVLLPAQNTNLLNQKFAIAQQLEKQGEIEKALEFYRELYAAQPGNNSYYTKLRRTLENLKMYEEWIRYLDDGLLKRPSDITLMGEYARAHFYLGNEETAKDTWNAIIALNPLAERNYRTVSQLQRGVRLYDDAINTLLLGRERMKNPAAFSNELANIYQYRQEYGHATREYLVMVKANSAYLKMVEQVINNFPQDSAIVAEVTGELEKVIEDSTQNFNFRRLLSGFYIKNNKYDKAFSSYIILDSVANAGGKEIIAFADQVFKIGIYDHSSNAYLHYLGRYPVSENSGKAKFGLARSYEENSRNLAVSTVSNENSKPRDHLDAALKEYESITRDFQGSQWTVESFFRIGEIKFDRFFDLDGAISAYEKVRETSPLSNLAWDATIKIGDCYLAKNDRDKAAEFYRLLETATSKFFSPKLQAEFNLILNDYYEGNFVPVKESLEALFEKTPKNNDLSNDIIERILFLDENLGGDIKPLLAYAKVELLVRQRKLTEALEILAYGIVTAKDHPIADDMYRMRAEIQKKMGLYDDSITSLEGLMELYPDSPLSEQAHIEIGSIYEMYFEDYDRAVKQYESFLSRFPYSISLDELRNRIRLLKQK